MVTFVNLLRLAMVALAPAAYADEAGVAVSGAPSGQEITYLETVQGQPGPEGLTVRFRFVAPRIARGGGDIGVEAAQEDMAWLCDSFAIPRLPETGPVPAQIVIALADRPVAFGEPSPEATQFFEAFSRDGDHCVWEPF